MKHRKRTNPELPRLTAEEARTASRTPLIIVLDNVRSLHNVGAVFRTADAFLVEKIYLCGITGRPPHKDIRKTALGADETVPWAYEKDTLFLMDRLNKEGVTTIAVEQAEGAVPLRDFSPEPDKKYALVFGHEVKGVAQEVVSACDSVVEIPQAGTKHSLNVAVSVGIAVWGLYSKTTP